MMASGLRAFLKFNKGMLKMPIQWQLWLMVLVAANMIAPLFFLGHLEARVVLGTIMASMAFMTFLTYRFGFTRILGLGHVLWLPMLPFLLLRLSNTPADDGFGIWLRVLLVLNSLSLILDTVDVIRYIGGDRRETVPGL